MNVASLISDSLRIAITALSTPNPTPPIGGRPYLYGVISMSGDLALISS